jgi:ferritin
MEYFNKRVDYYTEHPHDNNESVVKLEETKDELKTYIQDIDKKLSEHELNFAINFIADKTQEKMSEKEKLTKYKKEIENVLKVQEFTNKFIDENYIGEEHDKFKDGTADIIAKSLIRLRKECLENTGYDIITD